MRTYVGHLSLCNDIPLTDVRPFLFFFSLSTINMFDVFGSLKNFIKLHPLSVDNTVFRLHYRASVFIFLAFSIAVTSRQYFGDPIHCLNPSDPDTFSQKVLDSYCWIHSTFTLPKAHGKKVGIEIAHPGIDKTVPGDKRVYHAYYQWVCFVLFLQAGFFYLPRWLWKSWEGGRMRQMVLQLDNPIMMPEERSKKIELLVQYLLDNMGNHNMYALRYAVCELFNFVNVIGQVYFVDRFLGGEFSLYGAKVLDFLQAEPENRVDPMIFVFPRVTKCRFHRYGPSGDITSLDAMCVLPLNIINEKIYVFLWFWLVVLGIITGMAIVYRILTGFMPRIRFMLIRSRVRMTPIEYLEPVMRRCMFGDWFVLYMLSKNVDGQNFCEVIKKLSQKLRKELAQEKPLLMEESSA